MGLFSGDFSGCQEERTEEETLTVRSLCLTLRKQKVRDRMCRQFPVYLRLALFAFSDEAELMRKRVDMDIENFYNML